MTNRRSARAAAAALAALGGRGSSSCAAIARPTAEPGPFPPSSRTSWGRHRRSALSGSPWATAAHAPRLNADSTAGGASSSPYRPPAVCSVEAAGVRLRRSTLTGALHATDAAVPVDEAASHLLGYRTRDVRVHSASDPCRPFEPRTRVVPAPGQRRSPPAGPRAHRRTRPTHDPPTLVGPVDAAEAPRVSSSSTWPPRLPRGRPPSGRRPGTRRGPHDLARDDHLARGHFFAPVRRDPARAGRLDRAARSRTCPSPPTPRSPRPSWPRRCAERDAWTDRRARAALRLERRAPGVRRDPLDRDGGHRDPPRRARSLGAVTPSSGSCSSRPTGATPLRSGGRSMPSEKTVAHTWPRGRHTSSGDLHAGRTETSLMLAIAPERVHLEQAEAGPRRAGRDPPTAPAKGRGASGERERCARRSERGLGDGGSRLLEPRSTS